MSLQNFENQKKCQHQWYLKNRDIILERTREYKRIHKRQYNEYMKEYMREYRKIHKRIYHQNNPEKAKKRWGRWYLKNKNDSKFKLNKNMSRTIKTILKENKKGKHWESLVGYTLKQLQKYLSRTMPEGYTWQDYLDGKLHLDHIIPKSKFNFTKPEHIDFKRCWSLKNLQLLEAKKNRNKSDKIEKPFQPNLLI